MADFWSLLRVGNSALAKSLALIVPPILAVVLTQSVLSADGHFPSWLRSRHNWVERGWAWLTSPVPDSVDPAALPTAALGVAGVFVAVYFATVTFVISTTYKDATRKLRDQIVRRPESRWYAVFFTQAVVYVALALALPVVGRTATHLTLVIAGLSAALVVLSFGRIWITLFVLLEPTSLFPQIQRDLNRWVLRAYKLGRRRRPSSVAVHRANAKIRGNLETLNDLVTLILDREYERAGGRGIAASHDPRIGSAAISLLRAWEAYSQRKHTITTLPRWNPTRTQAKDWFLSSHSELSVALATGTTLVGSEVVDDLWYERWIADVAERLLAGRDLRTVESAVRGLPVFSRALGSRGQFEELRLWLTAMTFAPMTSVGDYAKKQGLVSGQNDGNPTLGPRLSREQHFALPGESSAHNLVDYVLLEALSACLGYMDYFERMRQVLPDAGELVVDDARQVVAGRLVLQAIANLRKALGAEIAIEGERVTPDNALTQLVARALATESVDEVAALVSFLEDEIWPWVIDIGGSRTWAAGAALSRATELTEKLETMLGFARQLLDDCESVHIETDDRWPETDTTALTRRAGSLKDRLELPVARLAVNVDSAPESDRPDHFGWAYYRAHENVLRRVLSREPGDPEQFRQKVALLYWAVDAATQRLLRTVRRHDQRVINSYVAEPYVRFLQLCGIALTMSEVTQDGSLFAPFESVWTGLLNDASRSTQLLGRAAIVLLSESTLFALTPGGIERSNIEIRANHALEEWGVPSELFDLGGFSYNEAIQSGSLSREAIGILRAVRSGNYEGMFYARWLRQHAIQAGATVPTEIEQQLHLLDLEWDDDDA
ncbi:hypothetical protein [Tessaracoccus oleiagri]|uniref:hypothetical protein n=1 Tax=Tessaracoccus oleiagri TaxID=686624 RepID=UPI00115FC761|nr:hypothetical protein [Tessaracoccus oleiagri]